MNPEINRLRKIFDMGRSMRPLMLLDPDMTGMSN